MILVNGTNSDTISATDRGLMYGDGVFRTMRIHNGLPFQWERHYRKLNKDCQSLAIQCPEQSVLGEELERLGKSNTNCVAKIIITRGISERGYRVTPGQPTRVVMSSPLPVYPNHFLERGVRVRVCDTRLAEQPMLAGIKHLNRLENVLARMEWDDPEIAEGLMLDREGHVIEGVMTNLFARFGDILQTPSLERCGVAGVQRDWVMELAGEWGLTVKIAHMTLKMLKQADEIILCNSVIGAWQIRELQGQSWNLGNLASKIRMATLP